MQRRLLTSFTMLAATLLFAPPVGAQGMQCTINFDSSCPNAGKECGASFAGGTGCLFAGQALCYTSGTRAYRVDAANPVTVTLDDPGISAIEVFFAHFGSAQGTMRFFDSVAGGNEVGTAFTTNGDCSSVKPPAQSQSFDDAVRRIEVTVTGTGEVWIDTMVLTENGMVPTLPSTWGQVKTIYR